MPVILGIQTVVTVVNQFFGSELGHAVLELLKSRIPDLSEEQKTKLDQHFEELSGMRF